MRSRRYSIRLIHVVKTIRVTVYADRSVEMDTVDHEYGDDTILRPARLQTREEAAWVLRFALGAGQPIERTFL